MYEMSIHIHTYTQICAELIPIELAATANNNSKKNGPEFTINKIHTFPLYWFGFL